MATAGRGLDPAISRSSPAGGRPAGARRAAAPAALCARPRPRPAALLLAAAAALLLLAGAAGAAEHPLCAVSIWGTQKCSTLGHTVAHFSSHLGTSVPIFVYVDPDTIPRVLNNSLIQRLVADKRLEVQPLYKKLQSREDIEEISTSLRFWRALPCTKVLLFQDDSALCAASRYRIRDFMKWDFVGAPWPLVRGQVSELKVGNGGLSLRTRALIVRLLELYPWEQFKDPSNPEGNQEDVYLARMIKRATKEGRLDPVPRVPTYAEAELFSFEQGEFSSDPARVPWGVHYAGYMHEQHDTLKRTRNICRLYAMCPEAIAIKYHCLDKETLSNLYPLNCNPRHVVWSKLSIGIAVASAVMTVLCALALRVLRRRWLRRRAAAAAARGGSGGGGGGGGGAALEGGGGSG